MILVMLGTQKNSFKRLLEEIEKCINKGIINEEVVVQAGGTKYKSEKMKIFDLIPNEKLTNYMEKANFIICHGGVGSIVSSIKLGKKVIAIPRYEKYGEHVNNHQEQIVNSFSKQGLIIGTENVCELENAISKVGDFEPRKFVSNTENVINIVSDYIDNN